MMFLTDLLTVRAAEPEWLRRGRMLSVLILSALVIAGLTTLMNTTRLVLERTSEVAFFVTVDVTAFLLLAGLLRLNQAGHVRLAAIIFLVSFVTIVSFAVQGFELDRVLILYVVPIMGASFLIGPASSFLFALLSAGSYTLAAYFLTNTSLSYNFFSVFGMFLTALIAWLAAGNLENALREIRKRAEELDQRVMERTSDLAEALGREHSEASKNEAVLQSIGDGVIVFDQNRQAIVVNPAACSILSCSEDGVIDHDINQIMGDLVNEEDQAIIRSLLESEASPKMGIKVNWGRKIMAVSFAPVRLPLVEQSGVVMVFRDITREAEVDRMKSEFVSIVSHELRTPMTAIKGYLELILVGGSSYDAQTQRTFLEVVKANADRLGDMVDELLDVSRIEAGRVQMRFQPVSMHRIIHEVAAMLQKALDKKGVELRLDVPADLPDVLADPSRVTQIVTNLMSNALKYTFEGFVDVTAHVASDYVQIDIKDTGIGMTEEDQAKLFTRFFRASTARTSDIPGTGLGLSITRSLIEMHGGKIWLKSAVGQGSTFSFIIPILPASLAQIAGPSPAVLAVSGTVSPKILIVDSELQIAQLMRQQLEAEDYTVLITSHGKDVLPLARREKPNLILLDILLQDVNGVEVLHRLKQDQDTESIPVVVTAVGPEEQKGFALGAADYLSKPIDNDKLLATVRGVLAPQSPGWPVTTDQHNSH